MTTKPALLIPVENQVRELDPKLLLGCVAALRGYSCVLGPRRQMHFQIVSFPRGVYLSKSVTTSSASTFHILRKLGHKIVAWDEEALVHLPPEIYFSRRLSVGALRRVSRLLAWGEDNAELWRRYPALPSDVAIHVTGNPRSDLLRPEIRPFYAEQAEEIRRECGNFILVNTNFNHINAFSPIQNLFQPPKRAGQEPKFGRAAKGMTREYATGLRNQKQAIFRAFQQTIPALEKAFPDSNVVIRPHPTERQDVYHEIAARCDRVRVTNTGNVVPWLMATRAVVHNGCTTGAEAYVMGVPAVSYRARIDNRYDLGFYRLPNLLSHQCFSFEELRETLQRILDGKLGAADGDERKRLVNHHFAAQEGPLACERIVDVVEEMANGTSTASSPSLVDRVEGRIVAAGRRWFKRSKARLPSSHNKPEFHRHRYPVVSLEQVRAKATRFRELLGAEREIEVEPFLDQFFRIYART